jgi:hypothetical protein
MRGARTMTMLAFLAAASLLTASAGADQDTTAVELPGAPMSVYVGPRGECQSSYVINGRVEGNFFPGGTPYEFSPVGDCGLFLAFPSAGAGQPTALAGKTFGFEKHAGASPGALFTPVSQSPVSGEGTPASSYAQSTVFKVEAGGEEDALVTETTSYVNGAAQFSSTYTVKNISKSQLYFRAIYAGDLFVNGEDQGVGVFNAGPPRFIGGQNASSGVLGGLQEAPAPALAWSAYEELAYPQIWTSVTETAEAAMAFNDGVTPGEVDNAVGVEWDQLRAKGLEKDGEASFSIVNRTQVPAALLAQPSTQTHVVGQSATVAVTALDTAGAPYANRPIVYAIGGANPKSGSVTTNSSGVATISYVGTVAGLDSLQMFLDLAGSGALAPQDPAIAAQISWTPAPATANSSYRIQSVHTKPNGAITIVLVPRQEGTALLEVTAPTATISSTASAARRQKPCKKGQVRIKRVCRPQSTLSGKVSGRGRAGAALTITVQPSRKVRAALKKGRKVALTAKLTYRSALGGKPTAETFHFSAKTVKRKHRGH